MKVDGKTNYNQIKSWPFFEAKRVLKRISKEDKHLKKNCHFSNWLWPIWFTAYWDFW